MIRRWHGHPSVVLVCYVLLLLSVACGLIGCSKNDSTSVGWSPAPAVPVRLTREGKGIWKAEANIPIENLGTISIDHTFDFREDYTYIVLRDKGRGTDQIFRIGVKASLSLHVTGEHDLTIHTDQTNRFVIEDIPTSGSIVVKLFPQGQVLDRCSITGGPEFVFLTERRMHVQYGSLYNALRTEKMSANVQEWFKQDETIPLSALAGITFRQSFRSRTLVCDWNESVTSSQLPSTIELPLSTSLSEELQVLESKIRKSGSNLRVEREEDLGSAYTWCWLFALAAVLCIFGVVVLVTGEGAGGCLVGGSIVTLLLLGGWLLTDQEIAGEAFGHVASTVGAVALVIGLIAFWIWRVPGKDHSRQRRRQGKRMPSASQGVSNVMNTEVESKQVMVAPVEEPRYFVMLAGELFGPFGHPQLLQLAAEGRIERETRLVNSASGSKIKAEDLKGLFVDQ